MPRIIDLLAVVAVAIVLLLPKASVTAQPALEGDPIELDRIAALQDQRYRQPESVEAALELADAFLGFLRPDWALATLDQFKDRPDYRVHLLAATARAERLEAELAVGEAARAEALCDDVKAVPRCAPGTDAKIGLIRQAMQTLAEQGIDPAKEPLRARQAVAKVLHSASYRGTTVRVTAPAGAVPETGADKGAGGAAKDGAVK